MYSHYYQYFLYNSTQLYIELLNMEESLFIYDLPLASLLLFYFLYFILLQVQQNKRTFSIQESRKREWKEPEAQRRKQRGYNYGAPWTHKWLPPCFLWIPVWKGASARKHKHVHDVKLQIRERPEIHSGKRTTYVQNFKKVSTVLWMDEFMREPKQIFKWRTYKKCCLPIGLYQNKESAVRSNYCTVFSWYHILLDLSQ